MSGLTEEAYQALKAKSQPVETPTAEAVPTTEEPKTETIEPQAQTEAPTEQIEAKVEPEPEAEVVEVKDEPEAKGWDDEPEAKVEAPAPIKLEEWVSDLGLGEIKSKDEFKTKVSELKSKLKEFEEKPLTGLPDDFREVIEVAKTGDWKDYMASQLIDFDQLNPIEEFERDFINRNQNNPKYQTEGKFDKQKLVDAIDAIPEAIRENDGYRIIQAEAQAAERQRAAIKAKAEAKRTAAENSLAQSTKQLAEILPLETYGIKFEPRHSSEIYEGIVNSKLTKKHLGTTYEALVREGADMKAIARTITLAEKGEKMIAYKTKNSEAKAKKDILTTTQNVQLNTPGTNPTPEDPEKKVKSTVDIVREWKEQSQKAGL